MKTYKTWEMIKELTEHPEKQFNLIENKANMVGFDKETRQLAWEQGSKFEIFNSTLKQEWEEVKQPVDFMTAVQAYDNGRTIYVLHGTNGKYKETFAPKINATDWGYAVKQQQGYAVDSGLILSGKWYIED